MDGHDGVDRDKPRLSGIAGVALSTALAAAAVGGCASNQESREARSENAQSGGEAAQASSEAAQASNAGDATMVADALAAGVDAAEAGADVPDDHARPRYNRENGSRG